MAFKLPPSLLVTERLDLLSQCGVTLSTNKTPPAWRDSSDPAHVVRERRGKSTSRQSEYSRTLSKPLKVKKKVQPTGAGKSSLELALLPHEGEPGPAHYAVDNNQHAPSGGHFSTAFPKSELEIIQHKAAQEPGPGDLLISINRFGMPLQSKKVPKWNDVPRASELDEITRLASQMPGPGLYGNPQGWPKHFATKFNEARVPSALDLCISRSNDTPAPHDYGHIDEVRSRGGEFSTASVPTALESILRQKRHVPGPCTYDTTLPAPSMFGKFNEAVVPSGLDLITTVASEKPGPGHYDIRPKHNVRHNHPYPSKTGFADTPGVTVWPKLTTRPKPMSEKELAAAKARVERRDTEDAAAKAIAKKKKAELADAKAETTKRSRGDSSRNRR